MTKKLRSLNWNSRDVQTNPADDIQADPSRSKSSLEIHIRAELKAEELYRIRRAELSYEVQISLAYNSSDGASI
ncbi:hypothetical protein F511_20087 [Dorcoceras hygrometricum]|uniref:Uncharacterized protein n=1 Tax=Dorcoceras hygrometricum TaxID=472368 RepID=A0A2Z7BRC5_9LAMI|nr:hypothetical protein F511_20087 [Dorcoceras hygrometricum]